MERGKTCYKDLATGETATDVPRGPSTWILTLCWFFLLAIITNDWRNYQFLLSVFYPSGMRLTGREYWIIYSGPGFFAVVWFASSPTPSSPPPSPVRKLDWRNTGRLRKRDNLLTGEGKKGWGRRQIIRPQESQALSINHSVLSVYGSETFVITGGGGRGHGGRQTGTLDLPLYALFLDEYKSPP